jgi:hypothetical protein
VELERERSRGDPPGGARIRGKVPRTTMSTKTTMRKRRRLRMRYIGFTTATARTYLSSRSIVLLKISISLGIAKQGIASLFLECAPIGLSSVNMCFDCFTTFWQRVQFTDFFYSCFADVCVADFQGRGWVEKLLEQEYDSLTVEERLEVLLDLTHLALEMPSIHCALDRRFDEVERTKRLVREEAKEERRNRQREMAAKAKRDAEEAERRVEALKQKMVNGEIAPFYHLHHVFV